MSTPLHLRTGPWWLSTLEKRAARRRSVTQAYEGQRVELPNAERRQAAIKFFNAALRAEQSGAGQAQNLSQDVATWDRELARTLKLYGEEEAWHEGLITDLLGDMGGSVLPMGRVTRLFFDAYARARQPHTIILMNLMFETIGATTYRLTLPNVQEPRLRATLQQLISDESFHVPLNIYFLRRLMARCDANQQEHVRRTHRRLFVALVALPIASRPKSRAFDGLSVPELARAYATELAALFDAYPDVPLQPPGWLLRMLGLSRARPSTPPTKAAVRSSMSQTGCD